RWGVGEGWGVGELGIRRGVVWRRGRFLRVDFPRRETAGAVDREYPTQFRVRGTAAGQRVGRAANAEYFARLQAYHPPPRHRRNGRQIAPERNDLHELSLPVLVHIADDLPGRDFPDSNSAPLTEPNELLVVRSEGEPVEAARRLERATRRAGCRVPELDCPIEGPEGDIPAVVTRSGDNGISRTGTRPALGRLGRLGVEQNVAERPVRADDEAGVGHRDEPEKVSGSVAGDFERRTELAGLYIEGPRLVLLVDALGDHERVVRAEADGIELAVR